MLSLFKLKKKSKKDKDQNQDDEKENTSSPTKVKKVEKSSSKESSGGGKKSKSKVLNENKQQKGSDGGGAENKSPSIAAPGATSTPSPPQDKLDTRGLDSPYKGGGAKSPLVVDVTTTPIVASSSSTKSPKKSQSQHKVVEIVEIRRDDGVVVSGGGGRSGGVSEPSPGTATTSSSSAAPTSTVGVTNTTPQQQQHRAPVLSASDAAANNSNSFIRGNFLSSTISGSDLNRYLNSGYLHGGDSYLQKPVDPKYPKSPHFHRPPNFSFYRNIGPNYVVTPRRNANRGAIRTLIMSSSSMSSNARSSRGQTMMSSTAKRVRSNSPPHLNIIGKTDEQIIVTPATTAAATATAEGGKSEQTATTGEEPVTRINIDNEEPIRLSKFSGGYEPDPQTPRKIESLDWPAPPYPAAVPELRARSRSSSNRHAHSTVHSVNGEQCLDDSDEEDVEVSATTAGQTTSVTIEGQGNESNSSNLKRPATKSASSSSSAKPKYQYKHHFFDNDYDDYLLQYRPHSEWRKHFEARYKPTTTTTTEDVNNNSNKVVGEIEIVEELEPQEKQAQEKLNREIEQISTLQNESSMAADLIKEIRAEQKMAHHKLKLDPWKASRTPSANAEPPVRTRFDSPVNASPSRVFFYNASGSHRIPMTPSGHTISTSGHLQSSTTASTSFFSPGGVTTQSAGSNSSTLIAGGGGGLAVNSSSSNNAITNTQSINYGVDGSSATSSAALITTTTGSAPPKSATLPVGTTSTPFYSSSSSSAAVSSSQRAHTLSNANTSPTITANATTTPRAGLSNNIVYNIAVPKPGYGLSSPNKSVTLPNSARYAGMPSHRSVDFERRAASPLYDSGLYSPPSPRTNYERSRFEHEMHLYSIIEQFVQLTKSTPNLMENTKIYPYDTLRILPRRKLPVDVDRQHLERHLSDDEFKQLFGMTLKEFYQLPYWKRVDMKKVAKLF